MKYSKCVAKCLISFAFFSLLACQASDYSNAKNEPVVPDPAQKPVFDTVAEGAINGRSWKFAEGRASLFKRNGKSYLEIKLWNQSYGGDPCKQYFGSTFQIRLYAENQIAVGTIDPSDPFNLIPTIIFSDLTDSSSSRNNMVASKGVIHVTSLANGRVVGGVQGNFTVGSVGRTEIQGNFDVPFCPGSRDGLAAPMNGSN